MKGVSKLNGVLTLILALALWETTARAGLANPLLFPAMSRILTSFAALIGSGEIPAQILTSLRRAAAGYFLAAAVFIPLGVAMGLFDRVYRALAIVIEALRPIPPPVVIPVAMLFFGLDDAMKIFVIFFSCAWPILLNTIDGVRSVDRVLVDTARTFGLARVKTILHVVLPAAAPQIATGLRISLSITLILVVISEMVGSSDGIGYFILNAQRRLKIDQMYAGMIALALLGYILNQAFLFLSKRLLHGR
ncbi:MAG TPA: ABC transporter permease [Verrucomicrobiae bacterium]|jgi:NitT/TauT family transport system permease protein|nr:ABC transporter permease [Verrucomicrobiae bacterium]